MTKKYFKDGINISYTTEPDDLNSSNLQHYDGLIVYANHDTISASQEKALPDFVKSGKGFIPLHSASFSFRNSPEVVEMIGGQFKSHRFDSFLAVIKQPEHPVMKSIPSFTTKDETYVHDKTSKTFRCSPNEQKEIIVSDTPGLDLMEKEGFFTRLMATMRIHS